MSAVFHENLRNARQRKGMSQQDVADKVGVAKSTYSMWETGNREPNLMKIIALTKVLDKRRDLKKFLHLFSFWGIDIYTHIC